MQNKTGLYYIEIIKKYKMSSVCVHFEDIFIWACIMLIVNVIFIIIQCTYVFTPQYKHTRASLRSLLLSLIQKPIWEMNKYHQQAIITQTLNI